LDDTNILSVADLFLEVLDTDGAIETFFVVEKAEVKLF
jgi:hypothetical protein